MCSRRVAHAQDRTPKSNAYNQVGGRGSSTANHPHALAPSHVEPAFGLPRSPCAKVSDQSLRTSPSTQEVPTCWSSDFLSSALAAPALALPTVSRPAAAIANKPLGLVLGAIAEEATIAMSSCDKRRFKPRLASGK